MPETPSEAFSRRLKRYRERRGWTQERLAEELTAIDWKVDRAQVAKIEAGSRKISLDEAIMVAWVLSLPPAFLYLPLGEVDDLMIGKEFVHPDLARKWVTGQLPAVDSNQRVRFPGEWKADMVVWSLHDRLNEAQETERRAQSAISSAEYVGDRQRIEQARRDHADALLALAESLQEIRTHGLRPPAIHEETAKAMRAVGIAYDGLVYPGPRKVGT